ncbi:dephospho-CoA kinase [Nicoliella spurrieriana]|uniref:Dephospho-CoA kinase n=1 Tax=Nicoliella spurrieriana TaxID=2925830 RepID=A0A976RRT0_9LACO|nr:dephospho-CoA kinase [Nicoliella spurrieriana]UQS86712.1 dephospho-CoA kinase [Nicoliella spurrieriana]
MTKLIGLTGSIGTGKSTVSKQFKACGVPIIDADRIVHQLQRHGTDCYLAIVDAFGPTVAGEDAIDRKRLGQIVFADHAKLMQLNRLLDPYIRHAILKRINELSAQQTPLVVLDAPLLFEAGYASYTDLVVMVTCDSVEQVARITARDHVSTARAVQLIGKQWSQSIKQQLANVTINNSGSIGQTKQQVIKLLDNLR